jgi:hypothetical protein
MALTSITRDFVVKAGALVEGTSFVTSSTGQTSTLQVNGGAAIAKNLVVGTTATIWGATTLQGSLVVNGYSQLGLLTATTFTATTSNITGNETVGGNFQVTGLFTATGASELGSTLKVTGNSQFNGALNTFSGALFVTGTNIFTVGTGASNFGGIVNVTNNTTANSAGGTGALVVTGGTLINDNLVVKSTAYNTATNTANAIYTAGAVYADKGLTVAGPVLFKDIVTFNGTATYVLSTNTYYTDNILEIHTPPTGVYGQWTVDDGKDIGFRFHYYTNSTDTNAALVLDNTTKYLDWYNAGAEAANGDFSTASFGTFRTGNIILTTATNATSTVTGSLQLAGGAGIGLAVYAGGNGSFSSLTGRNLTTASNFLFSDANGNIVNSPINYNYVTGRIVGTVDLANTATNIVGGASGSLPYQTGAGATTMLAIGTNGYILSVVGGNPAWTSVSGLTAGLSTTATNIAGGLADQIPYQTGPGQTGFNVGLRFNGTTFTTTNVVVSNNANATGYNNNTGALQVKGGAAINNDLWVGGDINLQGSLFLKGVGLDQITGSTGTFDFVIIEGTGTALTVTDGSTFGGITTVTNSTAVSTTASGAFQVRNGGIGIGGGGVFGSVVTATLFSGASTQVQTIQQTGNASYFFTFVDSNNASATGELVYTTSSFSVNPATGAVTVAGSLLATSANPTNGVAAAGAIQVTGGVGIAKDIYVGTTATVAGTVLATSGTPTNGAAATGAVQVTGGVSIAKDLYVGTTATVVGVTYHNNTTPSLASATAGAVQTTGGVGIAKDIYVGTTATVAGILYETNTAAANGVAAGGAVQVTGGVGIAKDIYVGTTATVAGSATVAGTLYATSTSPALTGGGGILAAVEVSGGVDITKDIFVGTTATVAGVLLATGATPVLGVAAAGVVQVTGGVGIAKDIYVGTTATIAGLLNITNTSPSLGAGALGSIETAGGVGIAKDLDVGTTATIAGITFHNNTTPTLASATQGSVQTTGGVGIAKDIYVGTTATVAGAIVASSTTPTFASATAGAVQVAGGVGIAKDLYVGTTATINNLNVTGTASLPSTISLSALTVTNLTVTNNETVGNNLSVANLFTATGAAVFGNTVSVTGIATFNNVQDSNATNNGSIVTLGGVGIAKNLTVGQAVTVGSATTQTVVNAYYSNNFLLSSYTSGFIVSNSQINLDAFSASAYRTCKYVIQIVDGTKIHVEEILLFHDGTNVYMTEYGIATSQGELGDFDAQLATGTVTLKFTANYTPTNMTIKTVRQAITL